MRIPNKQTKMLKNGNNEISLPLADLILAIYTIDILYSCKMTTLIVISFRNLRLTLKIMPQNNKTNKKQHFTWVTNFNITQKNVYALMRGGRTR